MSKRFTAFLCVLMLMASILLPAAVAVAAEEPITLTLFVDESWWPYDTWEGAIPEQFSLNANVNIEVIRAVDDNQLPLMVASGNMPDLVCSYRYQYMANPDTSYALDELMTQYPDVNFDAHAVM
jgi:putative aldouronate transport system substrate-binding protein